jgi:hypothetical protein
MNPGQEGKLIEMTSYGVMRLLLEEGNIMCIPLTSIDYYYEVTGD